MLSLDLLFHFLLKKKKREKEKTYCSTLLWGVASLGHWLAKLGCCVRPCKWKGGWSWLLDLECEAMIKKQNKEMVFKLNREKKKKIDPGTWVPMDEDMVVYVDSIEFPLEEE